MKSKYSASSSFARCMFIALASLPFDGIAEAQSPGVFSKLNVGDSTGTATGDGTFVAEGTHYTSSPLAAAYQTTGTRMLWYPRKAAFRAGFGTASTWNDATIGAYSTAMGFINTAQGNSSIAKGYFNTAQGHSSIAMGYHNWAQGWGSTAMGYYNTAQGDYSTAMGYGSTAQGHYSTAMGTANSNS